MHRTPFATLAQPILAPADARAGGTPGTDDAPVAEIVTFQLTPGSDEAAFQAAARATQAPVSAQPGFLRRVLSRDDSGLWTDHVEWASLAHAEAAVQAVMALPGFGPFVGFIDMPSLNMRHAQVLWTMGD